MRPAPGRWVGAASPRFHRPFAAAASHPDASLRTTSLWVHLVMVCVTDDISPHLSKVSQDPLFQEWRVKTSLERMRRLEGLFADWAIYFCPLITANKFFSLLVMQGHVCQLSYRAPNTKQKTQNTKVPFFSPLAAR